MPTYMPDIRRDWLTNQNMDWCFVVIGLVGRQTHSPLLPLKMDPVHQMGPPYWLAASGCQRIFINIRGQYGIQKNCHIYTSVIIHTHYRGTLCLKNQLIRLRTLNEWNMDTGRSKAHIACWKLDKSGEISCVHRSDSWS